MKRQRIKKSPTMKSPNKLNNSQDALLLFSPPSSMREISHSFRSNLNRHGTLQSRRGKQQDDESSQPAKHFRVQLQKLYEESFIKSLLDRTPITSRMNTYQKQVLDDLQFGSDTQVDDIDNICYKFMFNYFNNYPVIKPQGNFKIIWNLLMILNLTSIFLWLPFKLSFGLQSVAQLFNDESRDLSIEYVNMIILLLDVLVTINQAYIHKGKIINQRYHIMSHYLQTDFIVDLICFVSLAYIYIEITKITELQIILTFLFGIIKCIKVYQIFHDIQEYFNCQQSNIPSIVANITTLLYLIHLTACLQYGILNDEDTFLQGKSMMTKYMFCLNWASAQLTSAGNSSISADNNLQLLFSSFISLLSVLITAYITITVAFYSFQQYKKTKHTQYVTMMNSFMSINNINFDLQYRIRSYLDFICKVFIFLNQAEQSMCEEDVSTITNKLSEQLRSELKYQLQANILEQCKLISRNFSFKFRKLLVHYMEEVKTIPEQRIITIDQLDDSSIYFINKGEVTILFESINNMGERLPRNQIKTLTKGEHFGFHGFITANPRSATIISKGFCHLYKIQRVHFINLLDQFPDDKEIFYMIKDTIQIESDLSSLDIKCYGCKSSKHMVNKCPFLHFVPDRDRVLKQQLYPVMQERDDPVTPRKSKYINALLQRQLIADIAIEMVEEMENVKKSEDVSDTDSEAFSRTLSNIQSKSFTKSQSRFSQQQSLLSHRHSQTLTIPASNKSSEEIGRFEQEMMRKTGFTRKSTQKETAGFGAQFHSQMHNPILEKDEDVPYDPVEEEQVDFPKPQSNYLLSDKSPRISRRISQRVTFEQNIFGMKARRSSFVYDNYLLQFSENQHVIEFQLITQPSVGDFDKIFEFRKYFPQHNISRVIKILQKSTGFQKPLNSLYSFFYSAITKGNRMKLKSNSKKQIKAPNHNRRLSKQNCIKFRKQQVKTLIF